MAEARAAREAGPEAAIATRWGAGVRGPLRLEDGRPLHVIFPGIPGGGSGPDFRDALLEAGGDYLRGDVEIHSLASGWRAHGHHRDRVYEAVVLHVVGVNDAGGTHTLHGSGRAIPVLVVGNDTPAGPGMPGFVPPCALAVARGPGAAEPLGRLALRRLRMKTARAGATLAAGGAGQGLYAALLETLGGPANGRAFARLAARMPLAALLGEAVAAADGRATGLAAQLRLAGSGLAFEQSGLRPLAAPGRRIEAAARLVARLWPPGAPAGWPAGLDAECRLPSALLVEGLGRGMAIELSVNAILPVAVAAGEWTEEEALRRLHALPSPGTYGKLRQLERWLGGPGVLATAADVQGGLLLHGEYCSKGMCGRCPLSD